MSQKDLGAEALLAHAVKVERDGYRFYTHLAKMMPEKQMMDLFHLFAEDELRHEMTFKNMMAEIAVGSRGEIRSQLPLLERFLRDMEQFGSEKVDEALKGEGSSVDLIDIAIQLEKDSILFYSSLKKNLSEEAQKVLEEIVDEEFRHLSRLFAIRQGEIDFELSGIDDI